MYDRTCTSVGCKTRGIVRYSLTESHMFLAFGSVLNNGMNVITLQDPMLHSKPDPPDTENHPVTLVTDIPPPMVMD